MEGCSRLGVTVALVLQFHISETKGSENWETESPEIECGHDDWGGKVGLFLGPQYFLEKKSQVQFSFGAEGNARLVGPLLLGGAVGLGVVAETTLTTLATIQVRILRTCLLSISLDLRGGVFIIFGEDDSLVRPVFSGGMELRHDLDKNFYVQVRAGMGYLPVDNYGWLLDCALGLGLLW